MNTVESNSFEEQLTPVLDIHFDVAMEELDMQRPNQRHQLFAAAAAGNLSPIPSDNENSELAVNNGRVSEPYDLDSELDLPAELDITAEQPPSWDYHLEAKEDVFEENGLLSSRHRSYGASDDSLESFEKLSAKFSADSNGISPDLKLGQEVAEFSPGPPPHPITMTTPATPTSPTAHVVLPDKHPEKAQEKPRGAGGGARIVVPCSTTLPKPTTNGSTPKAPLLRTKPGKSRLPKMEHIQSSIPKPRPRSSSASSKAEADKKSAAQAKTIRENKSSINRKKNLVIQQSRDLEEEARETDYLTPLQKKNNYIKELEQKLKDTRAKLEAAEKQVAHVETIIQDRVKDIVDANNKELEVLHEQLREMEIVHDDLRNSHQKSLNTIRAYEDTVTEMKEAMENKEIQTNEMYLVMYRKGQESALFDREVQLEELAASAPQSVDVKELLAKLEKTQGELTKWQNLQMNSSYDGGEKPDTEASAKLRFLRDSMFHYLSDESRDQPQHLKAMIAILGFTEVQMKKIRKAVVDHHK